MNIESKWANAHYLGTKEIAGKIYLSVNNNQLYYLADELLKGCIEEKMEDYDFKVSRDKGITRRDGIIIYFNKENFKQYIEIINTIQRDHPDIIFNSPNCFSYRYNSTIGIGKDFGDLSFVKKCCEMVENENYSSSDESIVKIEKSINEHLKDLMSLCKQISEDERDNL